MINHLQHISDLVEICRLKGIKHIVVSPGSRNTPIIRAFSENSWFKLHGIVDERSAAFYALGISLATNEPVALTCTSGTAVLNYAPALAEAYYQHIPLIAITADRPQELIDQQDNQTIRQVNVFQNYIKGCISISAPKESISELDQQNKLINDLINKSLGKIKGPIQINVPISEPLNSEIPIPTNRFEITETEKVESSLLEEILDCWLSSSKRMIICGENTGNKELSKLLTKIASDNIAVVLAEPISNINGKNIVNQVDLIMMQVEKNDHVDFQPDILISFGGQIVSKRLKQWLQKQKNISHFRISEEEDHIDTYQNLNETIIGQPVDILPVLQESASSNHSFSEKWINKLQNCVDKQTSLLKQIPFSDLQVFNTIMNNLPENCILHLGNSSPVRYGQLFDLSICNAVYSNRGVSGIDGCLSTASGYASESSDLNIVILGDLSFLYDSNGLWNRNLSSNLRIVVINNEGGGIFSLISNNSDQPFFKEYIETNHPVKIGKLAEAYGIDYYFCDSQFELETTFRSFIRSENGPSILEIKTPKECNSEIYHDFIKNIKQ